MVLAYHNIAAQPGFYTLSRKAFERHLQILRDEGKRFVSLRHYLDDLRTQERSSENAVLITFDDAFASFRKEALPVLERFEAPAALFVPTNFLGRSDEWNKAQHRAPILSEETLVAVAAHPLIAIGSHSCSHRRLTKLDDAALHGELGQSKTRLEHLIARPITTIAYPYGQPYLDVDARVAKAASEAGYEAGFTTRHGIQNSFSGRMLLSRVDASMAEDDLTFTRLLNPFGVHRWKTAAKTAVSFLRTRF